ncbi:amidohydrolase family protein [Streptomyces sp. NPDC102360]|uniref:amidohydrolase family protein n=1 Tax=Streptomyces sp. NPDC102360 TaxID=3366160 RepID=UPI0037F22EAA
MISTLIRGGYLYADEPEGNIYEPMAETGDVLVTDGVITAVGGDIEAPTGAEVVDAGGKLIAPGFVDTHLHLWQTALRGMTADLWAREYFHTVHPMSQYFTPEDIYWATYAGGLELLSHGVTQVFDYCHSANSPEHVDASIRGLRDAGIRATYGFALFERESSTYRDRAHRLEDLARIAQETKGDALVDVALAIDHKHDGHAVQTARDLGLRISVHGNPVGLLKEFADAGDLGPDVLWAHGNFAGEAELDALAASGAYLSLTPDIEMGMGKPTAIFERAVRRGIPVTLGVDVVSYTAGDMFNQMHLAYALHRVLDGDKERARGHVPPHRDVDVPAVSARDIVGWATANGAAATGAGAKRVEAGAPADLTLIETEPFGLSMGDPAGHLVLQSTSRDVDTVFVGGQMRYRRGELTGVDTAEVSAQLKRSRTRLFEARDRALVKN